MLRDGELVFAAGVVTFVPLGKRGTARIPLDPIREAEEVSKKHDEEFKFLEYPVEVTVDGKHEAPGKIPGFLLDIETFDKIAHPNELRRQVQERITALRVR